jgi:hypothetical protein
MLLKQLETLGIVYVPTCLVGQGLVWHSMVPDLLGPGLAHHRLELGLASLRAGLDHLRVGLGIDWWLQLGLARDSTKESSFTTSKAINVLGVIVILRPVDVFKGIKFKTHFAKKLHGNYYIYFAADIFLPNSPRSSLHPNNTNRINRRMTALPNTKSTLLIAINTVTRPYTNGTATTQETES